MKSMNVCTMDPSDYQQNRCGWYYTQLSVFALLYFTLLVLLINNTFRFILKQWPLRAIELKLLYLAALTSAITRLIQIGFLFFDSDFTSTQPSYIFGEISSVVTIGIGLP